MARYPEITIGSAYPFVYVLSYAPSISIYAPLGPIFKITLTGNLTFDEPIELKEGQQIRIAVTQDGTGNRIVSFNPTYWHNVGAEPAADLFAGRTTVYIAYAANDGTGLKYFYYIEAPVLLPATQAGLVTWFDPTQGVTVNSLLQVSAYASRYGDHKLVPIGGTAANYPLYSTNISTSMQLNPSLAGVLANSNRLAESIPSSIGTALSGINPYTIYVVFRRGTTVSTTQVLYSLNTSTTTWIGLCNVATALVFQRQNVQFTTAQTFANTNPHISIFRFDGSNWTFWFDTVSVAGTTNSTPVATGGTFSILARVFGGTVLDPSTSSISDIIIYNIAHSTQQRNAVNNYLRVKHKI